MTTGNLPTKPRLKRLASRPSIAAESALVQTFAPGNYTAIMRGKGNTTGVAVAEVYNVP
jgi:hypothetical protein